ncbi:MAG: MBL fold metallo-hydrolase [Nitrospirae bacterium]|nr:MBL fold metallo-hydrolase [Candidatus Manganitrophaceae bacterium]
MFLQRYYLECLSHASYMVADEKTKEAVLIDPRRDIDIYLEDAHDHGFKIKHVVLTHFHADFIAGHIELRNKVGAKIYLGKRAEAEFDFEALGDGSVIHLGEVRLETMETPGHTPEGITLLAFDSRSDAKNPYAIFTGDTLFLGDVGRPDLLASIGVTANELSEMLYDSLHNKLLKLPGKTLVYPAHGAGSMCGKALSDEAVSTLEEQRRSNYALQKMSKPDFIRMMTAEQAEAPAYFVHNAILNRKERASLDDTIIKSMKALNLDTVISLQKSGAQVLDVRSVNEFAEAHLHRTLNIGIDGKYATWVGTLLNKDHEIVLIAEPDRIEEAIIRLGRIGFHNVIGYLEGGMESLKERPDLLTQTTRITAADLHNLGKEATIIDIRTANEWTEAHITGSSNIPLNQLQNRLDEVPESGHVIIHCQGGYRSMIAASIFEKEDRKNILDLIGGFSAWTALQLPTQQS